MQEHPKLMYDGAFETDSLWYCHAMISRAAYEHKFTLSEVKFDIDNWPKVEDTLFHEPKLISKRTQYFPQYIPTPYVLAPFLKSVFKYIMFMSSTVINF